jgi:hypothetical protein
VWTRPVQFRQVGAHGFPLKPLNSPRWIFHICSTSFLLCPLCSSSSVRLLIPWCLPGRMSERDLILLSASPDLIFPK